MFNKIFPLSLISQYFGILSLGGVRGGAGTQGTNGDIFKEGHRRSRMTTTECKQALSYFADDPLTGSPLAHSHQQYTSQQGTRNKGPRFFFFMWKTIISLYW